MTLNQDCVRALLLYLEENFQCDSNGRIKSIRLRNIYQLQEFNSFPEDQIFVAARYILEKKLVLGSDLKYAPKTYAFDNITALGLDYISSIRDNRVWAKVKSTLGDVCKTSIEQVVQLAIKLATDKLTS